MKFALRKTIDFAIVNCAAMVENQGQKVASARICLNAVAVKPYRAVTAEKKILGQELNEPAAEAAGESAISGTIPLKDNGYMVQLVKIIVKRTLLALKQSDPAT